MKLVEFYPNKQGRPAIIPTKDFETGLAPSPSNAISGIMLQASYTTTNQTNNYTAGDIAVILCNAENGSITVTLSTASSHKGKYYYIKIISSTGVVTVQATDLIDGELSIDLTMQYQYIMVICDGTTWHVIGGTAVKLETILDDKLSEAIQLLAKLTIEIKQQSLHLASMSDQSVSEEDVDGC